MALVKKRKKSKRLSCSNSVLHVALNVRLEAFPNPFSHYASTLLCRPRHSACKNNRDSLIFGGLRENWTQALRFQVSGVRCQ